MDSVECLREPGGPVAAGGFNGSHAGIEASLSVRADRWWCGRETSAGPRWRRG